MTVQSMILQTTTFEIRSWGRRDRAGIGAAGACSAIPSGAWTSIMSCGKAQSDLAGGSARLVDVQTSIESRGVLSLLGWATAAPSAPKTFMVAAPAASAKNIAVQPI